MTPSSAPTSNKGHCSLAHLLGRWSKLEPGTCRVSQERATYLLRLEAQPKQDWYKLAESSHGTLDCAVLQSRVQDALAQHGMNWRLSVRQGLIDARVEHRGQSYSVSIASEAMALLWAYLDALEQRRSVSLEV